MLQSVREEVAEKGRPRSQETEGGVGFLEFPKQRTAMAQKELQGRPDHTTTGTSWRTTKQAEEEQGH